MTNVHKAMEYAAQLEREAILKKNSDIYAAFDAAYANHKKEPEMNAKGMEAKAYYEKMVAQREDMRPQQSPPATPTSPIRTAVELMEGRICNLQEVTDRLFIRLKPITTNTDDNYPGEPCVAREGNSVLNIDLNAMSERLGAIPAALQLQIDRLEV